MDAVAALHACLHELPEKVEKAGACLVRRRRVWVASRTLAACEGRGLDALQLELEALLALEPARLCA